MIGKNVRAQLVRMNTLRVALDARMSADLTLLDEHRSSVDALTKQRAALLDLMNSGDADAPLDVRARLLDDKDTPPALVQITGLDLKIQAATANRAAAIVQADRWSGPATAVRELSALAHRACGIDPASTGLAPMPTLQLVLAGDPRRAHLDEIRHRLDEIDAEVSKVENAPVPIDEAIERFRYASAQQLDAAKTRMSYFVSPGKVVAPDVTVGFLELLLGREDFERLLRARFKSIAPAAGLPHAERRTAVDKLVAKHRAELIREELATAELEVSGWIVQRRREVDVAVVLEAWEKISA